MNPMRKLIFLILILGLVSTVVFFYFLASTKNPQQETFFPLSPITKEPDSLILSISTPSEDKLVFESDLLIQGRSSPQALAILSLNSYEEILELNSDGDFSIIVKLESGLNYLLIGAFDELGNSKVEERIIYYSKEKL